MFHTRSRRHRPRYSRRDCLIRSPFAWLTACSCALALAVAGCGSKQAAAPKLPATLAAQLAAQADAVAQASDAGDTCGAQARAVTLRTAVMTAINQGRVPSGLQEPLLSSANSLAGRIACVTPPPPPPPPPATTQTGEGDHGHGDKKHKKHKKHDQGGGGD